MTMPRVGIMLSGGFDPVHVGHVRMIQAAKAYRSEVLIALNSDEWLMWKKGYAFMPWDERAEILRAFHVKVCHVNDHDGTVCEALERVRPLYFGNGGDRTTGNLLEHELCARLGIEEVFGLGGGKIQSSSDLVHRSKERTHVG